MKDGEREADSMRECNAVESNLIWRRKEETKAAGAVGVQRGSAAVISPRGCERRRSAVALQT